MDVAKIGELAVPELPPVLIDPTGMVELDEGTG